VIVNELKYTTRHGVSVYIPFHDTITVIGGNSSTGKSFIKVTAQERYNDLNNRRIEVFDYKSPLDLQILRALKNKLIIIDNADIMLSENEAAVKHINGDNNNQYILFMRSENGIDVSIDNYAELQQNGKQLIAVYLYR
jgi:predicted RNA-binding protein (virulence factor B family)